MSRRDGHDWEQCDLNDLLECQEKAEGCTGIAKWSKTLYACDKSTYDGGLYCDHCRSVDDE